MSDKTREEFAKGITEIINELAPIKTDEKKDLIASYMLVYDSQQKKIDALKALNPEVPCPAIHQCKFGYDCSLCGTSGTVPLTKAQETRYQNHISQQSLFDTKEIQELIYK